MSFPPPIKPKYKPEAEGLSHEDTMFLLRKCLTEKQMQDEQVLRFIMAYLTCRSTSQAAREVGIPQPRGYSIRHNRNVHEAIRQITEASMVKYGYDANDVVERVKEVVQFDPLELINPDGTYKEMHEIRPEARRAIKSCVARNEFGTDPNGMPVVTGRIIKYEFWDKLKGAELLGREVQVFKETRKVEHEVTHKMADILLESERRGVDRAIDVTPKIEGKT